MCIRDRSSARAASARARRTIAGGGPARQDLLEGHAPAPRACSSAARYAEAAAACLLYTSDAADERSSVDLGGRRIIKKKNINKNRQ